MNRTSFLSATLVAAFAAASAGAAHAWPPSANAGIEAVRLMEVHGTVVIGVDGAVAAVELTTERLPAQLRDALLVQARGWRFRPITVKGKPSQAKTRFQLVLAATPDGENFRVKVDGVEFGDPTDKAAVVPDGMPAVITGKRLTPPTYPHPLLMSGRSGGVLLAILVDARGRAEKVQVLQSMAHDFDGRRGDGDARRTMKSLEANAVSAARGWTFEVPASAASAPPEQRTVLVPVIYMIRYDVSQPGYWIPVRRGPRHTADWLPPGRSEGFAMAASGSGQPMAIDSPFKMLKPVAGTTLD